VTWLLFLPMFSVAFTRFSHNASDYFLYAHIKEQEERTVTEVDKKDLYVSIVHEYMEKYGLKCELIVDEDAERIKLEAGLSIGDQGGRLFLEIDYDIEVINAYIYYIFNCKKQKVDEMMRLFNVFNIRKRIGKFVVFADDGVIRWQHGVDFEGAIPSATSIRQIVGCGWNDMEEFIDPVVAVAMTNQTAEAALAEFDEARAKAAEKADDDTPSEL
jgi:hypothetical protein